MDPITGKVIDNHANSVKAASTKPANSLMARHKADYKPPEHRASASSLLRTHSTPGDPLA